MNYYFLEYFKVKEKIKVKFIKEGKEGQDQWFCYLYVF